MFTLEQRPLARWFSQRCLGGVLGLQTQEIPLKIRSGGEKWPNCAFFPVWGPMLLQRPERSNACSYNSRGREEPGPVTLLISKEIEARCQVAYKRP